MCNVTAWRHSRLRAHLLMALIRGEGGAEGEVCILHSQGIAVSPISLLSMGGVCGRSLMAGKILFSGRQTCSLYLVLWLCAPNIKHYNPLCRQSRSSFLKSKMKCMKQNMASYYLLKQHVGTIIQTSDNKHQMNAKRCKKNLRRLIWK